MKKLAAIYNIFDGIELLFGSIKSIESHTDLIIIVYQNISNNGEEGWSPLPEIEHLQENHNIILVEYEPDLSISASMNERAKRNLGIQMARRNHCTHFLAMDTDEFYQDFGAAKRAYIESGAKGSVCKLYTYFNKPTYQMDPVEDYYVPFIHELREDTISGNSSYRFWVDPTRTINEDDVVLLPVYMHHFSWCRKDIMKKARNSSAPINLLKGSMLDDYNSPELGEGYYLTNWNRRIKIVPDIFGLSDIFK